MLLTDKSRHFTKEENAERARLIATAPELLACIISIKEDCSRGCQKQGMSADGIQAIIGRCDKYIKKAKRAK